MLKITTSWKSKKQKVQIYIARGDVRKWVLSLITGENGNFKEGFGSKYFLKLKNILNLQSVIFLLGI